MSVGGAGLTVRYCGHDGTFVADVYEVAGAVVVRAGGPVSAETIRRPARGYTRHLLDFPKAGFWRPELGVFVVPADQLRVCEPMPQDVAVPGAVARV